jgi:hypothetical protein
MPTEREKALQLLTGDPKTVNLLTMGLFQYYKWDQVRSKEAGKTPLRNDEIVAIADAATDRQWKDYEETASKTLRAITASEDKWVLPIFQGIISAFLYSLLLLGSLLIVKYFDIDVLHVFGVESRIVIERPAPSPSPTAPPQKPPPLRPPPTR